MSKLKSFGPSLNELSNGTTTHETSSVVKPSWSPTAYATALSKPLPVEGSLISHFEPDGVPPSNQGGKAGLSVPIVSWPALTSWSWSFAHGSGSSVVAAVVVVSAAPVSVVGGAAAGSLVLPPHDAARQASTTVRSRSRALRMRL